MLPRRANTSNKNTRNVNATSLVPYQEVSKVEFRNSIQVLAHSMTNQNNRVHAPVNENGGSPIEMVRDFVRINPPEFLGSQTNEDPQNFLDDIKKIFEVMQVIGNDHVKLTSYQLKDVAHIWYTQWKDNKGTDEAPITWECYSETFVERILPKELR